MPRRRDRTAILEAALERGIRHFDVARAYGMGAAESELGSVLQGRRDTVTVATKFGLEVAPVASSLARLQAPLRAVLNRSPSLRARARAHAHHLQGRRRYDSVLARSSLERSLRELRTDYVDVFLVHDPPSPADVEVDALASYLESARTAGQIRTWGFAGDAAICTELAAATPTPCVLQFSRDILSASRTSSEFGSDPAIIFGVLSEVLSRIVAQLARDPPDHVGQAITRHLREPANLAPLLILDALEAGPQDVVLFSTTSQEHLRRVIDVADAGPDDVVRRHLLELRQLLTTGSMAGARGSVPQADSHVSRRQPSL